MVAGLFIYNNQSVGHDFEHLQYLSYLDLWHFVFSVMCHLDHVTLEALLQAKLHVCDIALLETSQSRFSYFLVHKLYHKGPGLEKIWFFLYNNCPRHVMQ